MQGKGLIDKRIQTLFGLFFGLGMSALVAVEYWLPAAWRIRLLKPFWSYLYLFQNEIAVFVILPAVTNMPVILVLAVLTGYVLAKVRHPRPILYTIPIWPLWTYAHFVWFGGERENIAAASETWSRQETTLALYFIQYSFFFLVTYLTYFITRRANLRMQNAL